MLIVEVKFVCSISIINDKCNSQDFIIFYFLLAIIGESILVDTVTTTVDK